MAKKQRVQLPHDADIQGNIRKHEAICIEIGVFIGAYAALELALWRLYAHVLGYDEEVPAIDLLGATQSFHHRMNAIRRFLPNSKDVKNRAKIKLALAEAAQINDFRIDLVHGWYFEPRDRTRLWLGTAYADPTDKKVRNILLSDKLIKGYSDRAIALGQSIMKDFSSGGSHITLREK